MQSQSDVVQTTKSAYSLINDVNPLVRLAIPLALTGTMQGSIWFFETLFLSQLGEKTLAAGALVSWFFGTIAVILFGALSSINILVAHEYGANDHAAISRVTRDGLLLAILYSIPTVILLWNAAPIFLLVGQSDEVVVLARAYLHALSFGLTAVFLQVACLEVIMGLGRARVILGFSIITVVLNVIISYILIFGKFGVPALGIAGAGWGMTISYWLVLLIMALYILISPIERQYFSQVIQFRTQSYLWELFQIGFPTGVMYCVEVAFFFALTVAMGMISTEVQAANQIAVQYLGLFMSTMFAVSQAITVRMGHLLGAGDVRAAEKACYIGVGLALAFILIVDVFYLEFPSRLITIFFDVHAPQNFSIVAEITKLLAICALFQIAETVRIAMFGALRGLKDTRFTMYASIISFWFIALPVGYLLAMHLGMGGAGYWWGMILGASMSVLLLQWRFGNKIKCYYQLGAQHESH